ncbi:TRAP transporter small permease [Siccirubricoccus sp. KC 17139]|uniref:TRAP transporter small permease protein n=1 Tax=Siccirubricoccus soli TaxID=2899147 RepID=A0ABT1D1Z3_9PROT|nr:TRAP transporter small permease [Siccirubricoccus soli]MCO6415918.1 TRAP transporter small permease [Siccirubricoccus soli]MCP2682050.1 TRAP transporter small permease [Siccirubricoccus soli]
MEEEIPPRGPVARLGTALALAGGTVLLATALLATASVLRRWATAQPIPGDFELVSLGSGLAVMGFLAQGTLTRSNILVDSFTTWLPARVNRAMDAFWTLVWLGVAAVLAERLLVGARETLASGTTTMVLGLPTWWAVGLGGLCFAATALSAAYWAWRLVRGRG